MRGLPLLQNAHCLSSASARSLLLLAFFFPPPDVYLYPRVDSVVHIDLFVDGQSIRVPRSRDVNPKNAHLANFVLCDEEQHALFQLVSRADTVQQRRVLLALCSVES